MVDENLGEQLHVLISSAIEQSANDADALESAHRINGMVRKVLARQMGPRIQSLVANMPSSTYTEKQRVAKFVNFHVRSLGLSICDPVTSRPSYLRAISTAGGRFSFLQRDESGKHVTSSRGKQLRQLTLMPEPLHYYSRRAALDAPLSPDTHERCR